MISLKCNECNSAESWDKCTNKEVTCPSGLDQCLKGYAKYGETKAYARSCSTKDFCDKENNPVCKRTKGISGANARSHVAIKISATLAQQPRSAVLCCWHAHWYSWHSKKHETRQTFPISWAAFSLGSCHGKSGGAENFNSVNTQLAVDHLY